MTSRKGRAKLLSLLACSLGSCWFVVPAVTLVADGPTQFRVSDSGTTSTVTESFGESLIGPSGPIHAAPVPPRSIPIQQSPKQLGLTVAHANSNAKRLNLMDLQVAESGEAKPAPKAAVAIPGRMVLQDLKAPPATAPADKAGNSGPINVIPLTPAPQEAGKAGKDLLRTESMIGQLADSSFLFSKLNISAEYDTKLSIPRDFRSLPSEPGLATRSQSIEPGSKTAWFNQTYTWVAPAFHHKPLYFEQPNLERYGVGPCRLAQPVLSSAHFFSSFVLAPYKMLTQHPCEKVYTLGHCRPGNLVPVQRLTLIGQSYPGEVHRYWEKYSGYR